MTREQLDKIGLHDQEPFAGFNHYTLYGEGEGGADYLGTYERRAIGTLDPTIDRVSLVIRHHQSPEEALAYYEGLTDYDADSGDEAIYQTEEGSFTLITRPIKPSWPGPLIIYCVDKVPADNPIGETFWVVAVAPDGTHIEELADFS
jgi:hypothetical protein